jgi:RNA polymerase sigma factor (sigma-70 family)
MKLKDIWYQYENDPDNEENTQLLCQKIQLFAKKVIHRFKINNPCLSYEDLLQQAYICFYDIIPQYDPRRGSLEGFFLTSFRNHIISLLRKQPRNVSFRDTEDTTPNQLELLLVDEFDRELDTLLTKDESDMYNDYLKVGNFDYKEIAKEENISDNEAKWLMDSTINKIRMHLKERKLI